MGSHVAAPALFPNLKYDSTKNFEPIGLTAHAPVAIVARKDFPAKDLREFIAYVRKNPEKVKQAHGGQGAASHMACLLFNSQLGLKPTSVAYRGTGPALNDLMGGHVDFFCEQVVSVAELAKSGVIKAYAVSSDTPSAALPNVPTAKSAGAPDYRMSIWSAIFAPKGTPKEALDKLTGALDKALDDPDVAKRLGHARWHRSRPSRSAAPPISQSCSRRTSPAWTRSCEERRRPSRTKHGPRGLLIRLRRYLGAKRRDTARSRRSFHDGIGGWFRLAAQAPGRTSATTSRLPGPPNEGSRMAPKSGV